MLYYKDFPGGLLFMESTSKYATKQNVPFVPLPLLQDFNSSPQNSEVGGS